MHSPLRKTVVACSLVIVFSLGLAGCGGSGSSGTSSSNNPVPTVTSLSPASGMLGAASQTVTINGAGFVSASSVTFNAVAHTATYVSATDLTISLSAADQAVAGTYAVIVTNAAPGGGASAAVNFAVNNPAPTVTSLAPSSAIAGAASQTVTITGTNFVASSTVTYNGVAHMATYVSATSLTISLTAADLATAGSYPVVVTSPAPGGGASGAVNFAVNNPVPTVTAISPVSALAGAAAQTLTVTGTNFVAGTAASFNGTAATATIVSSTQLTLPLTAADQAVAGSFPVVVTNPAPGGGSSVAIDFVVGGSSTMAGTVYKGASVGSTVTAYEVNADGSDGTAIGTATTDTSGNFSLALTTAPTGAVRVTATGGTYASEFDASSITGTSSVSALFDSVTANISGVSLTPASEFVSSYAAGLLSAKTVPDEPTAHKQAATLIGGYLGLSTTAVIETLVPVFDKPDIAANPDNFTLGLYIGSLATEGHTVAPSSPDDLIAALSSDISDGVFDGKALGTAVPLARGVESKIRMKQYHPGIAALTTLSPTAGTTDLLLALGTYINTGTSITAAGILPTDVSGLESAIFGGVSGCKCNPPSSGLLASSSGATTTYSENGRQYLILAARQEGVVIVDITDPTTKTPPINAWPAISATTFAGNDVGGVIAVTGLSGHPQVIAFAYESQTISVLNLDTLITGNPATDNPVDLTTTLTLAATSPVVFSGGEGYIAGGVPDNGRGGVWLSTADGYGLLKLSSLVAGATSVSLSTLYPVQDTGEIIAENLGADIGNNQLLGGNYGGIQLVDLTQGASYYLPASGYATTLPDLFVGETIDGNAVDNNLRVGVLTSEDSNATAYINLGSVTETPSTTQGTLNALTPAAGGLVEVILGTTGGYGGTGPDLDGAAVDPTSHLALYMNGYSTDIAVSKIQDPSTVAAGAAWTGLADWSYYTLTNSPELANYNYATDPHSVGVVVNQTTGTPFGYLFDGATDHGIVQVDMTNFLAMARAGTTGDALHQPAGDPGATATPGGGLVVQEFTWTDPTAPIAALSKKQSPNMHNEPLVVPLKKQ